MTAVKMRQCISCGDFRSGREMLRIVKTPDGEVRFDATGRSSGRGAYICKEEACVQGAFTKHGIDRSLHVKLDAQAETDLRQSLLKEMNLIEE